MGTTALLVSYFLQLSWHCFSVLPLLLTHVNYIFFDVSYALPSVKFKRSYYALFVNNFYVEVFQFIMHFTISRRRLLAILFITALIVIMQNAV